MKAFLIDDWNILKEIVPGIKPAVLNTVKEITGEPLEECLGDRDTRGYREGTRWLHIFGIEQQVFDQILYVVQMASFNFRSEIERAKNIRRTKPE